MSIEVLTAKFEAHKQDCDADKLSFTSDMKEVKAELRGKVSYKNFWTVLGILMSIILAVFGYISSQLDNLTKQTSTVQGDVSFLKGKLSPYDVQFTE